MRTAGNRRVCCFDRVWVLQEKHERSLKRDLYDY